MAVTQTDKANVSVIDNSIGLFHKQFSATGDGSGGNVIISVELGNNDELTLYYYLTQFYLYVDDSTTKQFRLTSNLRLVSGFTGHSSVPVIYGQLYDDTVNQMYNYTGDAIFMGSKPKTTTPALTIVVDINTNTSTYFYGIRGFFVKDTPLLNVGKLIR